MCKNFFRTFVASLLICSMLVVPGFAEDAIVSGSDVNVRSGPGINYPVVACLPRNAAITVTDRSNGDWYAISYNGVSGFMSSRYIDIVDNEGDYEITVNKTLINADKLEAKETFAFELYKYDNDAKEKVGSAIATANINIDAVYHFFYSLFN